MNLDNLKTLIKCYEDNLELIYNTEHDELFKWRAVQHFRDVWYAPENEGLNFAQRFNKAKKRACIFLDRDGVINKDMDSNPNINEFELLEGVGEAIKRINQSDYLAVIVTNQPMIAKGFIAEDKVHEIHKKMETLLGEQGAFINEIYYCPHHPEKGFEGEIPELKIDCECRKPKSGMLLKAQKEMNIDLEESWMIGDNERDLIAGKNVGCKTVYISKEKSIYADYYANNLKEAVNTILENS